MQDLHAIGFEGDFRFHLPSSLAIEQEDSSLGGGIFEDNLHHASEEFIEEDFLANGLRGFEYARKIDAISGGTIGGCGR